MAYFDPVTHLPAYFSSDPGVTLLADSYGGPYPAFDAVVPADTVTLRWRWGFAPGEIGHRDYPFERPPENEAHIWVQTGGPAWALFAPKTDPTQRWIWQPGGVGWVTEVAGVTDTTDTAPGGCDWGAVTALVPGGGSVPEIPYKPSSITPQEGDWGVVRLRTQ